MPGASLCLEVWLLAAGPEECIEAGVLLGRSWTASTPRGSRLRPVSRPGTPETFAWHLFTKRLAREDADRLVAIEGDRPLGAHVFCAVAIVG